MYMQAEMKGFDLRHIEISPPGRFVDTGKPYVAIRYTATDTTGLYGVIKPERVFEISDEALKNPRQFALEVKKALLNMFEHETEELLTVNGMKMFDPHADDPKTRF